MPGPDAKVRIPAKFVTCLGDRDKMTRGTVGTAQPRISRITLKATAIAVPHVNVEEAYSYGN
jgi:hypothetical protein